MSTPLIPSSLTEDGDIVEKSSGGVEDREVAMKVAEENPNFPNPF